MVLNGWKEIAKHLQCGVRTAQRWELLDIGLPVHRPKHNTGIVCAFTDELDDWLRNKPQRSVVPQDNRPKPEFQYRVLVVDDDEQQLSIAASMIKEAGYDVRTAQDGFHALSVIRAGPVPDLLVSDLRMPNMSGFELLTVVRKRFPAVAVIAMSACFTPLSEPTLLADAFLHKQNGGMEKLVKTITELLSESPLRAQLAKPKTAPTWIPHSNLGYIVITCPECLRSFSMVLGDTDNPGEELRHKCVHCGVLVPFRIDPTLTEFRAQSTKPGNGNLATRQ